jgi:foldase protein PrsA
VNRFFDRHKKTIIWVMVIGFFLGSVGLAAFQYMSPGGGGSSDQGDSGTTVALVVNGDEVPESEFQNTYDNLVQRQKSLYSQFGRDFSKMLEGASGKQYELRIKSSAMDSLIQQTLVKQEADKKDIKVSDQKVDSKYNEQLNSLLEQQGWTLDQLKSALSAQGRTYDKFQTTMRKDIRAQLRREELRNQVVGEIDPTDEELKTYYNDNIDTYVQSPSKVKASHLVFGSEDKAKEVKSKIDENPDYFNEYAKENDLDTDMGWFQKGEKSTAIDNLAFSLDSGEVGGPVETPDGWQVLRVNEKQERQVPSFEEIRDKVSEDYVSEEENSRYQDWYNKVKSEADIDLRLPVVEAYRTAQDDFEAGLEAYGELEEGTEVNDPYIPYYIGRLYQRRADELGNQSESSAEVENVQEKISEYEEKAVDNYLKVVRQTGSRDGDLLNRVKGLAPDNAEVNYYLGRYNRTNGSYSRAAQNFEQAIESNPDYVGAYVEYGDMLVELEDYKRAIKQYKSALERADQNVNILNKLAQAYGEDKQYEKAVSTYQKTLDQSANNFTARKGLGDIYMEQGKVEKAIDNYNKALGIRADAETSLSLARAYLQTGELEDAKMELDSVLSTNPYSGEAYMLMGDYYLKQDSTERALEEYRQGLDRTQGEELTIEISSKILEQAPGDIETRFALARAYQSQHVYESAIEEYREILNRSEATAERREAYAGLGEVYTSKTEYGKAKEFLKKGLKLAQSSVQRLDFYQSMLKADEEENGKDNLSSLGKEALLGIAEVRINQGNNAAAEEKLNRLKELDSGYKEEKVKELMGRIQSTGQEQG